MRLIEAVIVKHRLIVQLLLKDVRRAEEEEDEKRKKNEEGKAIRMHKNRKGLIPVQKITENSEFEGIKRLLRKLNQGVPG